MDIRLPDGRIVKNVPEGTTKQQIAQKFGLPYSDQSEQKQPAQQEPSFREKAANIVGTLGTSAAKVAGGVLGIPGEIGQLLGHKNGIDPFSLMANLPNVQEMQTKLLEGTGTARVEPESSIGKMIAATGEGALSGALLPVGKITQLASAGMGATSGLGAEAAGQMTEGSAVEPYARLAGALVGGSVGNKLVSKKPEQISMTAQELREKAGDLYKQAELAGGNLKADATDRFVNDVMAIRPKDEVARMLGAKDFIAENADAFEAMRGQPMTLERATAIDQRLTDLLDNETILGKPTQNGRQILLAQRKLRDIIDSANPSDVEGGTQGFYKLKEARSAWAKAAKLRDIEAIINKAQYMDQPASSMRSGLNTLLSNPNRLRGYTPEEVNAIKKAAKTGLTEGLFRTFGSGLTPIGSSIAGTTAGGPIGGAVSGVPAGFRAGDAGAVRLGCGVFHRGRADAADHFGAGVDGGGWVHRLSFVRAFRPAD